jgi:CubicO group peptidase (beta-lactamase class C family)
MKRLTASFVAIAAVVVACVDSEEPAGPHDATATIEDAATHNEDAGHADAAETMDAGVDSGIVEIDTPITDRFRAIAESFERERQNNGAPGAALLILENGEITFAHGFGSKDPAGDDPVHSTTLFRIGSVNKMLTAAALLQFVADGTLQLDDPVTKPIPELSFTGDATWAPSILIRHLLTHSSAIVDYIPLEVPEDQQVDGALQEFLTGDFEGIAYLMAPAGVMWNYSNPGYALAGLALEKQAGVGYREAMKERVFAPLHMDRTYFLPTDVIEDGDYAKGLSTDERGRPLTIEPQMFDNAWLRPAGYAFSSVRDLAQFVLFLESGNTAVLPDALREAMAEPQMEMKTNFDLQAYGFGLFVARGLYIGPNEFHPLKVISHGGNIPGFTADVFYVPSLRFGYIALASKDVAYFRQTLGLALRTLTTLPPAEPAPQFVVDPSQFVQYAGVYLDEFNIGPVQVTAHSSSISVSIPELDRARVPYEKELIPVAPDNFIWRVQGYSMPTTFIDGEDGKPGYFRTRPAVARRVPSAGLWVPHARFDRERFLREVREAAADSSLIFSPR